MAKGDEAKHHGVTLHSQLNFNFINLLLIFCFSVVLSFLLRKFFISSSDSIIGTLPLNLIYLQAIL